VGHHGVDQKDECSGDKEGAKQDTPGLWLQEDVYPLTNQGKDAMVNEVNPSTHHGDDQCIPEQPSLPNCVGHASYHQGYGQDDDHPQVVNDQDEGEKSQRP
jgi:hypothetical protein